MRKFVMAVSAFCITVSLTAQDLVSKIPSTASAVVSINGKNLLQLMSLDEFSNSKFGTLLEKELAKDTNGKLETLEDLGLDYDNSFYYFFEMKEGVFTNCFLVPLNSSKGFLSTLRKRNLDKTITEGDISYFQNYSGDTVTMWNENVLMFVMAIDNKIEEDVYGYDYYDDYQTETVIEEIVEPEEEVTESSEEIQGVDYYNSDAYKKEQEQREIKRQERREKREARSKEFSKEVLANAKKIISGTYANKSILTNTNYIKSIGKGKQEASVWVNDFATIYEQAIPSYMLGGDFNPYNYMNIDKLYKGVSVAAKLDFDKGQAVLKTEYTMSDEIADLYRPMYNGKINKNFVKYVNEDKLLGYMSLNLSTEGVLMAYPKLATSLFDTNSGETLNESVALGAKIFSMLIDEEEAAKIIRGDMFLALTNLSEKEVTYTDYEYDADFNYKEVDKTKTETIPDFMYMFTSEEQEIFNRLVRIGLKENKLEAMNGVYRLTDLPNSTPFNIYITQKDNTVFFGSSLKDMTAIKSGTFVAKLSGEHKKNITKNASSIYVNGKKIVSEIPVESFPRDLRDKVDFLTSNTEDIKVNFHKIKGNTMKGELIWETPSEGHKNSFVYFIDMIDVLMGK
ncbi:DUF4836 family protein [Maribacter sp. TH_r10]|uniref:DUF4836 family protein n=1 Tax=Maribacter sp. TH_r10 TaxID=3082086 RepID=UPI0029549DCC|nr:DUF4836 family protein [Maribacter sp. TH_r10]MDV7137725.1 DUF4836 family protein [Maribacter sp. TH_r10]